MRYANSGNLSTTLCFFSQLALLLWSIPYAMQPVWVVCSCVPARFSLCSVLLANNRGCLLLNDHKEIDSRIVRINLPYLVIRFLVRRVVGFKASFWRIIPG